MAQNDKDVGFYGGTDRNGRPFQRVVRRSDMETQRPVAKSDPRDVNLPDEQRGQNVGRLPYGTKSEDPLKQKYMDRIKARNVGRAKHGFYKNRPESDFQGDLQQEEQSRDIFGGDADDPRWAKYAKERGMDRKALIAQMTGKDKS